MKFLTIIGMVSLSGGLYAGYVGDYLGLSEGKVWIYAGTKKDSILYQPSITGGFQDTVKIVKEFLYNGDSAYLEEITHIDELAGSTAIFTDTLLEEGDSLIGPIHMREETTLVVTLYKIPFEIGKSWYPFGDTLYIIDINGDGTNDTMRVIENIKEVIAQENISVPFGEIKDAYKLKGTFRGEGWVSPGFPFNVEIHSFEWYKPSFGKAKDTSYQIINAYYDDSIIYAEYRWQSSELNSVTGIEERRSTKSQGFLEIRENPFSNELFVSLSLDKRALIRVSLYNVAGREVERIERYYPAGQHILRYRLRNLPNGVYFLRIYENGKELKRGKVISIE